MTINVTDKNGKLWLVPEPGDPWGQNETDILEHLLLNAELDLDFYETFAADSGSVTPNSGAETLTLAGGTGISTSATGDTITFTLDNPDKWTTIQLDTGSTTANSVNDTLTIQGGTNITTSVSGDTITIDTTGQPDQNLWETIAADTGSTSANSTTDTLTIAGGPGISTSISGDTIVIENTGQVSLFYQDFATDSGTAEPTVEAGTLTITGGTGISTSATGDTLTITNTDPGPDVFNTITADTGSTTADQTNDTLTIAGGTNVTTTITGDTLTIDTSANQNLWETITADTGSTTADSVTDTLNIVSGTGISTSITGDTLTITGQADQNLWETITADSGSTTANSLTDTLTVAGGTDISTSITGDTLTLNFTNTTGYLTEIVQDTTPQLGGNLDLNGNVITGIQNNDEWTTASGDTILEFKTTGGATDHLLIENSNNAVTLKNAGGVDIAFTLASTGAGELNLNSDTEVDFFDEAGNDKQFSVHITTNAVNNLVTYGGITGSAPVLEAEGTDTDVGISMATKNNGLLSFASSGGTVFYDGTFTDTLFSINSTPSAVNHIEVTPGTTGNGTTIDATGSDTNVDLLLNAQGSGNVLLSGLAYPNSDGTNGQVLTTDGSGGLSFGDINRFISVSGDSGSTTADVPNDSLLITGGSSISTSVTGDTLTINTSALASVAADTSPQLGGDLDPNGFSILIPEVYTFYIEEQVTNQFYTIDLNAPFDFKVTSISTKTSQGTCTVTLYDDGSAITNYTNIACGTTKARTSEGSGIIAAESIFEIEVTNLSGSPEDLAISINTERV